MNDSSAPTAVAEPRSLDKSNERVSEMFRQIAPRYDQMNHTLSMGVDFYWRWRAVRALDPVPDRPILDVCTGTGDLALAIAKRYPMVEVIGSDFCDAMLEIAREKRNPEDTEGRVEFVGGDAQRLPYVDNYFGAVTVAFGLRNVADTHRGLTEMTRVCAPGGQVMVLEFAQPTAPVIKQVYGVYFHHVLPRVGQYFARNEKSAYEYLPESVGVFPFGRDLTDMMSEAGLVDCQYTSLSMGTVMLYTATKPHSETVT